MESQTTRNEFFSNLKRKIMLDFEIFLILRAVHSERFENLPCFTGKISERGLGDFIQLNVIMTGAACHYHY